ncbi:MAG: phosphonate ABC transporter, permease protein PhnE [Acidimicrobiales bacterium]
MRRRVAVVMVIAAAVVWSISGLDVTVSRLLSAPGDAWAIFRRMVPPDFSGEIDRGVIGKVLESVYIAWIGTLIAAIFSFPLAFLAANNVAPVWVRAPVRMLFNAIRAVPELIVAVILLGVTGLGPWAGALAIGFHSIGTLGKLSTEAIEGVDSGPIEAVEACGGRWVSGMRWGVLPQVLPIVVSYWLFRFEINVRASAVLGLIGAGGVGSELVQQLNFRNFDAVGAVLAVTVVVVLVIDTVSSAVRRRIILGGGRPLDDRSREAEALADVVGLGLG